MSVDRPDLCEVRNRLLGLRNHGVKHSGGGGPFRPEVVFTGAPFVVASTAQDCDGDTFIILAGFKPAGSPGGYPLWAVVFRPEVDPTYKGPWPINDEEWDNFEDDWGLYGDMDAMRYDLSLIILNDYNYRLDRERWAYGFGETRI